MWAVRMVPEKRMARPPAMEIQGRYRERRALASAEMRRLYERLERMGFTPRISDVMQLKTR